MRDKLAATLGLTFLGFMICGLWPSAAPGQRESVEAMLQRRAMALRAQIAALDSQIAGLSQRVPVIEREIQRLTEQTKEIKVPDPEEEIEEPPQRKPKKVGFRPPFEREVEKNAPLALICQNNRIGVLDFDAFGKNFNAILDNQQQLQLLAETKTAIVSAGDYQIRINLFPNFILQTVVPIPGRDGETESQALRSNSRLMKRIAELNAESDLIQFVVYPDSFDVFRATRQELWKREFGIQWSPLEHGEEVNIGSGPLTQQ